MITTLIAILTINYAYSRRVDPHCTSSASSSPSNETHQPPHRTTNRSCQSNCPPRSRSLPAPARKPCRQSWAVLWLVPLALPLDGVRVRLLRRIRCFCCWLVSRRCSSSFGRNRCTWPFLPRARTHCYLMPCKSRAVLTPLPSSTVSCWPRQANHGWANQAAQCLSFDYSPFNYISEWQHIISFSIFYISIVSEAILFLC